MIGTAKVFAASLLLGAGGCALLEFLGLPEAPKRPFNHKLHLAEGLECASCHRTVETADQAGMPQLKQCMLCHQGIDEQKPQEKRLSSIYGPEPSWSDVTRISDEVKASLLEDLSS